MSQIFVTDAAKKIHRRLLERVLPLRVGNINAHTNGSTNGGALHIADQAERPAPHRPEDQLVIMGEADEPSIVRMGPRKVALSYNAGIADAGVAALTAASTGPAMPIAADTEMLALLTLARKVASGTIPVLIEGPTGTGKEVLSRFLHMASPRSAGPFIAVNCAAMPETMLEAMLFGHRKGAFTGATDAQQGFFRAADGGTLLLDEIGEMPLALQAKLLRALQEGEVVPLGATTPIKIDVRIIACTNRDLPRDVEAGLFREDLYYRLNVFPLRIPPLRERTGDIAPLAFGLLLKHGGEAGAGGESQQPRWIADNALDMLRSHPWPGNVRELENVMRRAILLADGSPQIGVDHITFDRPVRMIEAPAQTNAQPAIPADDTNLSDIAFRSEAKAIIQVLDECGGKRGETARRLGISERTLRYRLADMRDAGLAADVAIAGARS